MLNKKIWLKFFGVMVGMMVLVGVIYAEKRKGEVKKEVKSSWELVDEAYKQGKIDYDTAFLYKYYAHHFPELLPSEYKAEINIPLRAGTALNKLEDKELIKNWNKFRKETKERIKFLRWKEMLELWKEEAPTVRIIHPKDNEVIYSPQISVKGIIKTPEIYKLTNVWIEVSGKRYEIKLPKPEYIPPEDTYEDEKGRKNYLKWKERYKDKPGLAELFGPPGKKLYPFTQKVRLERYGLYQIKINAENERGRADESVWIVYAKKDSKDKTPPVIKITGIKDGQKFINPRVRNVIIDINDENLAIDRMYLNGREVGGISLPVCSGERGITLHLQPGENIFEVIAIDKSGNKSSKKIKIYLEK